jgi:hypothetical protein
MPTVRRFIGLTTLAAFFGLMTLEAFHGHFTVASQAEQGCAVCKIAHQAPALTDRPDFPEPEMLAAAAPVVDCAHPFLPFVFPSHGLSPPAL